MHVGTYLLKIQIDNVILDVHGQACPGMPQNFKISKAKKGGTERGFKTLIPENLIGVFKLILCMQLHIY